MPSDLNRRVLVVAPRWDYGDRLRGNSFEYDCFGPAITTLSTCITYFDSLILRGLSQAAQYDRLHEAAAQIDATAVFCVLFRDELDPAALSRLRDQDRVPVVNWFCDDHWRYAKFSRHLAPHLSLSVTTDAGAVERYRADGFPVLKSQWGVPSHAVAGMEVHQSPHDRLVFVGQAYGARASLLATLEERLEPTQLEVYGFGSANGRLSASQMYSTFNSSLASLNFSDSWNGRLREAVGRVVPSVRRSRQLKARTFEVAGAGGVLITQQAPELERYFEIGTEVHVAESASDIVEIVRMLAVDKEARTRMATAARLRALSEHTMERRLKQVFDALDA